MLQAMSEAFKKQQPDIGLFSGRGTGIRTQNRSLPKRVC